MKSYKLFFLLNLIFSPYTYGDNRDKCDINYRRCIKPSQTMYFADVSRNWDLKNIQQYIFETRKTSHNKLKLDDIKICLMDGSYYVVFKEEKIELTKVCIEILEKCSE